MYCIKCGNKLDDDALFCSECGYKLDNRKTEQSGAIEKNKKVKGKGRKLLIVAVIGLVGLALITIVMLFHLKKKEEERIYTSVHENYYEFFSVETEEGERKEGFYDQQGNVFHITEMVYDADGLPNYISTKNFAYSGSGDKVSYAVSQGITLIDEDKKVTDLVKIRNKRNVAMPGSMYFTCSGQKMSFDGNAIAFQARENLYTWTSNVAKDAIKHNQYLLKEYVISPNSRYILYVEEPDNELADNELYYAIVGVEDSSMKVSENVEIPLAVSDSGKDFYYIGKDGKLYYSDGEQEKCLSDFMIVNIANAMPCYFNETCDEIIYSDGGITRYYCAGDAESKIIGRGLKTCIPYIFEDMAYQNISTMDLELFDYNIVILGKKTFANSVFHDGSNKYWLDENANQLKQIGNEGDYLSYLSVSEDYSTLIYMKNNQIYKVDTGDIGFETCIYDVNDVVSFSISSDFKDLYIHTNTGKILYFNLLKREEVKTVAEISDIYYGAYNEAQDAYFVCTENMELYKITPKKQSLLSTEACLVDIPRIGSVTYTVYGEDYDTADVCMLMEDESSKILYSY